MLVIVIGFGQTFDSNILNNEKLQSTLKSLENKSVNADSAWSVLTTYNEYPVIKETGKEYIFFYSDSVFGKVPIRVFIPKSYSNNIASPTILVLHGAVGASRFSFIDSTTITYKVEGEDYTSSEGFYEYLCSQNKFIVVRPIADPSKKFDWVANLFKPNPNLTYITLTNILIHLKQFLNINDNKIFAYGHSDGSDGVFGLDIYKPSLFAGFVGYNSMLSQIWGEVYLRNMMNKPFYLVHSDLDDLRPIQQTRLQIKELDSIKAPIIYKEYIGYGHEDKHLFIDRPYSITFLNSIERMPFSKEIYWETDNTSFNNCDWINITELDTLQQKATWQTELNSNFYDKTTKGYYDNVMYYRNKHQSGAIKASYNNNIFNIQTSRVVQIELLISPVMVNVQNTVTVIINGKTIFNNKVQADKNFILNNFKNNFDRQALWVTTIKLKVE